MQARGISLALFIFRQVMMRFIGAIIFGFGGIAILLWLGYWQVQRLEWKSEILREIDARIAEQPVILPQKPDPEKHRYLPVILDGEFTGEELHVLFSIKNKGPGYRIIAAFVTDGREIMVDRGFIPLDQKDVVRPPHKARIVGNLYWPDEVDSYTPTPDESRNIWFARDVIAMSLALKTYPYLVVAREATDAHVTPVPVDSASIPNDHLQYAITWFLLASVWFGMTAFLLWRIRHKSA